MIEISKPKILTPQIEKIVFYLFIAVALFNVWRVPAFITMDGPAHLYNSSLLNIFDKSNFLQEFLNKNHPFLPNLMSHLILKNLVLHFDFFFSEKIFVSLIILLLPITFRMLIKVLTNEVPYYSFFIFPIVFTNLLYFGFYNFCLGFVFFNIQVYLIVNITKRKYISINWILLFLNSFLLYYCHLFGYVIAITVGSVFLADAFWKNKKELIKHFSLFILIHIPTFIFTFIFFLSTNIWSFDYDLEPYEKSIALLTFSPGIVFERKDELPYAIIISILLISLIVNSLTHRFNNGKSKIITTDIFLLLAFLTIYLIFHSKDGDMGGMFVKRLIFLTFYFFIIWAACNAKKNYAITGSLILVIVVCGNLWYFRNQQIEWKQKKVIDVEMARDFIDEKSVVQSVLLTDNIYEAHISSYLGINKEIVLLENYEAVLPWFPLTWNKRIQELPDRDNMKLYNQPDYIFIYGDDKRFNYRFNDSLKNYIFVNMDKVYESSDMYCQLFRQKKHRLKK